MNHDADITEVSDPRDLTIDDPPPPVPEIQVLKGNPTDDEIAALATVLAAAGGGTHEPGPQELNPGATRSTSCGTGSPAGSASPCWNAMRHMRAMTRVVLGSASTGRLSVLRQAGVDPSWWSSRVSTRTRSSRRIRARRRPRWCCALAEAKADGVAAAAGPRRGRGLCCHRL